MILHQKQTIFNQEQKKFVPLYSSKKLRTNQEQLRLKICNSSRTASLNPKFTGSYNSKKYIPPNLTNLLFAIKKVALWNNSYYRSKFN